MFFSSSGSYSFTTSLADEAATYRLMTDIAAVIEPGDVITLSGDLGAGKTTFARALIRYLAGDDTIEVPSPTFTLTQTYTLPRFAVVHVDLYRLSGSAELAELGLDDAPEGAVTLVEWPDRAAGFLPADRLEIALTLEPTHGPNARNVQITGYGSFARRAERIITIRRFLDRSDFGRAERRRIQGDASTRSYERLTRAGATYMLMNSPKREDGPPVRNGKSYSTIAHLAETVTPFIAMAQALRGQGFSAPAIFAADREAGLLVIEDLGDELVVEGDPPVPIQARYEMATDMLAELHREQLPGVVPVQPGVDYRIPPYDMEAFLIEVELLLDWYLPKLETRITNAKRESYRALWREALLPIMDGTQTWVLRDFHSPNLLWLPEREGTARVGLLDFQDAVMGPAAYDVASLLQDARVDVPEMMEIGLLSRYTRARRSVDAAFDAPAFARAYATLTAQRASKILGIFARLERRDHKPQYLRHLPRVWAYLQRSLAHPALAPLAAWYRANVPPLKV
jgi:tRNA threonylcarbamoyl adenosine modification protein YjeE